MASILNVAQQSLYEDVSFLFSFKSSYTLGVAVSWSVPHTCRHSWCVGPSPRPEVQSSLPDDGVWLAGLSIRLRRWKHCHVSSGGDSNVEERKKRKKERLRAWERCCYSVLTLLFMLPQIPRKFMGKQRFPLHTLYWFTSCKTLPTFS